MKISFTILGIIPCFPGSPVNQINWFTYVRNGMCCSPHWIKPTYDTLHCMCFSRTGLPVSKYSTVVASQHIRYNAFGSFIIHFFLCCIGLKYFVKQIYFTLKKFKHLIQLRVNVAINANVLFKLILDYWYNNYLKVLIVYK